MADKPTKIWQSIDRRRAAFIPSTERVTSKALWKQAKPVFEQFLIENKGLESILQDVNGLIREPVIKDLYNKIYTKVGVSFASASFNNVKSGQFSFDKKASDILEMTWESEIQKIVELQAAQRITGVTQTTKDILSRTIQEAINEGLSVPQAAKKLMAKFGDLTRYRSRMIARTEIVSASNEGSLVGAESTGLPFDKVWLSTRDKRTRPDHLSADGQRKKLNEPFILRDGSRLRVPGDPAGPGHQVIQCRCTQIYLQPGQTSVF